jgi:transposase
MDIAELHLHWGERKYKGKTYRSYSLARPYRQEGKNRKEIVMKLGKLSDEEADRWRNLLKALKQPDAFLTTLEDIITTEHYAYLNVAAVNEVWDEWELDHIFLGNGKRDISIATIARILTINRCLDPAAKSKTPDWFGGTALRWLLNVNPRQINPSRIFRELVVIEKHKEATCKYLFTRLSRDNPESMKSVFYDLSSTSFSGSRCILMKWGHCKDGFKNHVVLALVVNQDGLPFYWEVLPGGTSDPKTIIWLLERLKERFKINGTTLVFDRGMVSDDNLTILENEEIKYISAMDKNQIEGITGLDFSKFSYPDINHVDEQASNLPEFTKINDDTYYREIKVEGTRRYILCFNPQLFKDQRKARRQAVEDFRIFVKSLNTQLQEAKNSRQYEPTYEKFRRKLVKVKLNDFVDVSLQIKHVAGKHPDGSEFKARTYEATVVVDDTKMLLAGKLDGFWLLVTNHTEKTQQGFKIGPQDAINPYRDKVIIESAFRDIKSFIEIEPIFVWTDLHVKAHYTICVLSHLINQTLTLRLHKHKGDATKEIISHEKLYRELSDCLIDHIEVKNVQKSKYNMTRPTNKQKELLHRVGLKNLLTCKILEKANASNYA